MASSRSGARCTSFENQRLREAGEKSRRIAARCGEHRQVVECRVPGARILRHGAHQHGLARLSRAVQQHDRAVGERGAEGTAT
jgi:hypothetical protein